MRGDRKAESGPSDGPESPDAEGEPNSCTIASVRPRCHCRARGGITAGISVAVVCRASATRTLSR